MLCFQWQKEGSFGVASPHRICLSEYVFIISSISKGCDPLWPADGSFAEVQPPTLCSLERVLLSSEWGQVLHRRRDESGPRSSSATLDAVHRHVAPRSTPTLTLTKHPHLLYFTCLWNMGVVLLIKLMSGLRQGHIHTGAGTASSTRYSWSQLYMLQQYAYQQLCKAKAIRVQLRLQLHIFPTFLDRFFKVQSRFLTGEPRSYWLFLVCRLFSPVGDRKPTFCLKQLSSKSQLGICRGEASCRSCTFPSASRARSFPTVPTPAHPSLLILLVLAHIPEKEKRLCLVFQQGDLWKEQVCVHVSGKLTCRICFCPTCTSLLWQRWGRDLSIGGYPGPIWDWLHRGSLPVGTVAAPGLFFFFLWASLFWRIQCLEAMPAFYSSVWE